MDPAGVVRKEYQAYNLATKDGRVLSGLIVEQTPEVITLRDAKGQRTRVARSEIEELKEMETSLMPESLYKEFSPEQLRDLFSFFRTNSPKVERVTHERAHSADSCTSSPGRYVLTGVGCSPAPARIRRRGSMRTA